MTDSFSGLENTLFRAMKTTEVHNDLIDAVKAFLANRDGFYDANDWDGLFNYRWKPEGLPYGYAIFDAGKMVGFLGTIFSERIVDGKKRVCCCTTSWYVEEGYRTQMLALRLFAPILRMKELLITNMSPTSPAVKMCETLGYKYLDQEQVVIPTLPWFAFGIRKRLWVTFEPQEIEGYLKPEEKRIFEDHAGLACKHFLIQERTGEYCYGIANTTPLRKLRLLKARWLNLCYVSNPEVFKRNYRYVWKDFWKEGRFLLLRYDARLLPGGLSRIAMRKEKTRMYKSAEPVSWTIDNIYSELVTFNKY